MKLPAAVVPPTTVPTEPSMKTPAVGNPVAGSTPETVPFGRAAPVAMETPIWLPVIVTPNDPATCTPYSPFDPMTLPTTCSLVDGEAAEPTVSNRTPLLRLPSPGSLRP